MQELALIILLDTVTESSFDTEIEGSFSFLVSAAEDAEQTRRDGFHESELFTQDTNQ